MMASVAGFPLWDASAFGSPWLGGVSTQWTDCELHTITLARCRHEPRGDLADIAVSTSAPGWSGPPHQALTIGGLLSFAIRLAAVGEMTAREAALTLVGLSHGPGRPVSLTVAGRVVDARRFDVPVTGDWVATSMESALPVSVAGREPFPVPELEVADETPWRAPLLDQTETGRARR